MMLSRRVVRLEHEPALRAVGSVWAVEETFEAGTRFKADRVDRLTLVTSETGRVYDASRPGQRGRVVYTRGSFVLMRPGAKYRDEVGEHEPWHVYYLMLAGPWADQFCDEWTGDGAAAPTAIDPAPLRWRQWLRESVRSALDQPPGWRWMFLSRLSGLLGDIAAAPPPGKSQAGIDEQVRQLVDTDPYRPWSVEQLAEALDISSSTLAHRFRQHTGRAPAAWVRSRRIELATRLLASGLTVSEVADRLGFANPYHFSRAFKSVTGMPPSTVRVAATESAPFRTLH